MRGLLYAGDVGGLHELAEVSLRFLLLFVFFFVILHRKRK